MLNVVCLDHKNYRKCGTQYVRNLYAACRQHITLPFQFVCFSDRVGYGDGILTIKTSEQCWGWWQKLFILGGGQLPKGSRCLLFDLDTLILRNIDDLAAYSGPLAGLGCPRDNRLFSSGILAWEAGRYDAVWTDWLKAGKPILGNGDDEWIDKRCPEALRLQKTFSGIVSYKYHKCKNGPPPGTRIIFFQREPKPDNCGGWAHHYWSTLDPIWQKETV